MRFHQLPVGQPFTYHGQRYVKRNDLMAVETASGKQQLIKRSALVEPVGDDEDPVEPSSTQESLPSSRVMTAFEAFWKDCNAVVDEAVGGNRSRADLANRLEQARQAFLDKLTGD